MNRSKKLKEIDQYRASPAINQSSLSALEYSPYWFDYYRRNPEKKVDSEEKAHLRLGSAVDCLLTTPDDFDATFCVMEEPFLTGLFGDFVKHFHHFHNVVGMPYDDAVLDAHSKAGFKVGVDTIKKKLEESHEAQAFLLHKKNCEGKVLLTQEDVDHAKLIVHRIKTNPGLNKYFEKYRYESQVPIYFNWGGIECKALLDFIFYDDENKKVYPVDLKTTAFNLEEFPKSVVKFGYFRQAAFYSEAIRKTMCDQMVNSLLGAPTYELQPFRFMAVETKNGHSANVFVVPDDVIQVGLTGGTLYYDKYQRTVKGIEELLEDYRWHLENKNWETNRAFIESNFETTLGVRTSAPIAYPAEVKN